MNKLKTLIKKISNDKKLIELLHIKLKKKDVVESIKKGTFLNMVPENEKNIHQKFVIISELTGDSIEEIKEQYYKMMDNVGMKRTRQSKKKKQRRRNKTIRKKKKKKKKANNRSK